MSLYRRCAAGLLALTATGALAAAPALTPVATAAAKPPVTKFVTISPWTNGGKLRYKGSYHWAGPNDSCWGSSVTGRHDALRCMFGHGIFETLYKSPTSNSVAYFNGRSWQVWRGVPSISLDGSGLALVTKVILSNGATCIASAGAFSPGPAKYQLGAGYCSGGAWGRYGGTWRAPAWSSRSTFPLVAGKLKGRWQAAVEVKQGKVVLIPVTIAYR